MGKQAMPVQEVRKPIYLGDWHGRDAMRKARTVFFGVLLVSFLYLIAGVLLSLNSLVLRIMYSLVLVAAAFLYFYYQGMSAGQSDASLGEIIYQRSVNGKPISPAEHNRCYHPLKGYYAALLGVLPFFLLALVFAILTVEERYSLGVLPTWLTPYTRHSGIGDALQYYTQREGVTALLVIKIIVRSMTMPFINVAVKLGTGTVLLFERLAPIWVLIAPLGFGIGYRQGPKMRNRINTGIAIGDRRKKQREKRERKVRQHNKGPERLI